MPEHVLTITARHAREAYALGLSLIQEHGVEAPSRAGPVLVAPCPVVTVTLDPTRRVLLDPVRDANPFLHLYESLWMLAGRRDGAALQRYAKNFRDFTEDGGDVHDAYGYRWRRHLGFDQLDAVVERLRRDPSDRQCVLQMWDAANADYDGRDGGAIPPADDLLGTWRTRPCNTHCYLRVRAEDTGLRSDHVVDVSTGQVGPGTITRGYLDLTVCCRSNDLVWGAHGANAVHFSVLQEYLAARVGVGVGRMYQVSNNYHAYRATLDPLLEKYGPGARRDSHLPYDEVPQPLVADPSTFDYELEQVLRVVDGDPCVTSGKYGDDFNNPFLWRTLLPLMCAHREHRAKRCELAVEWARSADSPDWARAAVEWLGRRGAEK